MSDTIVSQNNTVQPKRYLTISVASDLAKSPSSYIEHLCAEGYLPCAYDMNGNFLPEAISLIDILKLPATALDQISFVDPSSITNNENGLPSNWKLKTSRKSDIHHEDLPLFPILNKKVLLGETTPVLLDNKDDNPLISNPEIKQIESINTDMGLIEVDDNPKLESGTQDVLLDSGKAEEEFMLDASDNPTIELPNANNLDNSSKVEFVDNSFDKGIIDSATPVLDETKKIDEVENSQKMLLKDKPRNPKQYSSVKILPIPHVPLAEVVLSNHPLTLPPSVIPFGTNTPSLKSKVAAIYTQPDAMASKWLPWMRTSMWSKKMVRRATHNVEIEDNDSSLPMVLSSKNEIAKNKNTPIARIIENKITQKPDGASTSNPNNIIIEPMAERVSISDSNIGPKEDDVFIAKPKSVPPAPIMAPIEINDSLDAAIFKDFTKDESLSIGRGETPLLTQAVKATTTKTSIPPKIEDSWDSAVFS